ncbi:glycosyltransferase family 4 protein [Nocardiopsis sp. NPDC006139]|uniref:glycosyltransferase family 4 protein n=1 Tax=Nocardiopsis sp. NPDC006139 TaxID=3154578 RepID=UPI0033A46B7A
MHAYPPTHNAGAEWMLHSLLRALVERGHEVTVSLSRYTVQREPYTLDGVRVVPLAADLDLAGEVRRSRVVVSHLENVPSAGALARGFGSRFVVIGHNTFARSFQDAANAALVVYNSDWMIEQADAYYESHQPAPGRTIRVSPSVLADDYRTTPGDAVTLVNLNEAKGGHLFWELAKRMPDHKFLGVRGAYGEQVVPQQIPDNVEIIDHVSGHEMRDAVYARTRVLLMPSAYESWGRVGAEALASGIPVITHPNPGTVEMLGSASILADRTDPDAWVATLERLDDTKEYQAASKRASERSAELDPHDDLVAWCEAIESL